MKYEYLWAKTESDTARWLPLYVHLSDTAETAKRLWDAWLSESVRRGLAADCGSADDARRIAVFLAAAHDFGKATPAFQTKARDGFRGSPEVWRVFEYSGLVIRNGKDGKLHGCNMVPHALAGAELFRRMGLPEPYLAVIGGHHGAPPTADMLGKSGSYDAAYGLAPDWNDARGELLAFILRLAGLDELPSARLSNASQAILSGFVIMCDWLASNTDYFPLIEIESPPEPQETRIARAWERMGFPSAWVAARTFTRDTYAERFGFAARPVQADAADALNSAENPGLVIIEAPMGEGKTEAALAAAEILAKRYGKSGVFIGLPTQATSDGIWERVQKWAAKLAPDETHTIHLAHGKARFNRAYQAVRYNGDEGEVAGADLGGDERKNGG
ncbi:MAG: CRISPR-associated endonuclease Cas3'', partial [Oscillospiraceae bacterium]|nr:CRISPR-associated endonuclease Cas3'' [Oscillospiraceae bacterium]